MTITTRRHVRYSATLPDVGELDTSPFDSDESCFTPEFRVNPNKPDESVLLFSQWDRNCESPLDFGDCEGEIYHCNRNYLRHNEGEVRGAFGLTDDGLDLQGVFDSVHNDQLAILLADAYRKTLNDDELLEIVERALESDEGDPPFAELLHTAEYEVTIQVVEYRRETVYFTDIVAHAVYELLRNASYWDDLPHSGIVERALSDAWLRLRERGVLGNPLAVPLGVYGRNCERYVAEHERFPEELPDGVWYPNEGALGNLLCGLEGVKDVSSVYEWQPCGPEGIGDSKAQQYGDDAANGAYRAYVKVKDRELSYRGKPMRSYAQILNVAWRDHLNEVERAALWEKAYNYADGVCKEYSAWAEGDCHYIVCMQYALTDAGEWERVDYDTCGGFIGSQYAEDYRYEYAPAWVRVSQSNEEQQG